MVISLWKHNESYIFTYIYFVDINLVHKKVNSSRKELSAFVVCMLFVQQHLSQSHLSVTHWQTSNSHLVTAWHKFNLIHTSSKFLQNVIHIFMMMTRTRTRTTRKLVYRISEWILNFLIVILQYFLNFLIVILQYFFSRQRIDSTQFHFMYLETNKQLSVFYSFGHKRQTLNISLFYRFKASWNSKENSHLN